MNSVPRPGAAVNTRGYARAPSHFRLNCRNCNEKICSTLFVAEFSAEEGLATAATFAKRLRLRFRLSAAAAAA